MSILQDWAQDSTNVAPGRSTGRMIEIRSTHGIPQIVGGIWQRRELLYFLIWKDIKVKYKQTTLGIAWALLQPLAAMLLFTLLFGQIAKLPSDGMPYPIFYYSGLLVWSYFSGTLIMTSNSVVTNTQLVTKVYFPRILLPTAAVFGGVVDLAIASIILVGLLTFYEVTLTWSLLLLPVALFILVVFTASVGQFLAALTVNYRDIKYALPFLVQMWFFASPVIFPLSMVPNSLKWVLALNPMVGIIELVRAAITDGPIPWGALATSCMVAAMMAVLGLVYFSRTERRFADTI